MSEAALLANGYQVLTRSPAAGTDAFVRQEQSLFLFFQSHSEYGASSLLSEYRRDVGRFLKGERGRYPAMPQYYFDAAIEAALAAFRERAEVRRHEELLAELPLASEAASNRASNANSQPFAVAIYRNWLSHLSGQKQRLLHPFQYVASPRLERSPTPAI